MDAALMKHWTVRKGMDVWQGNADSSEIKRFEEGVENAEPNV